ncbi:hypothetical protein KP803_00765 [Vibrio sp. ZSDE26]|uniref:Solute-binding protein family 3/N-terminal domain-containing protein n=1 Tax=Vibrio amylolyticus TaxID=2847292 RepID=A0A9X2BFI6_9VIBR|nr:hypothetical protein [Vibrio amylolyticus]MCK6261799.1 hypothetical protein [Vibrio amylolyticus]
MEYRQSLGTILLLLLYSMPSHAADLQLNTFYSPPMVNKEGDLNSGITHHTITEIFHRANVDYDLQFTPKPRALKTAKLRLNTCSFPVTRSQLIEADFVWIGPVAISQYALYSKESSNHSLFSIRDAVYHKIVAYEDYAITKELEKQGYNLMQTKELEDGIRMLRRDGIDFWLSDIRSAKSLSNELDIPLTSNPFVFLTDIKYLACNKKIKIEDVNSLQKEINEMLSNGEISMSLND